MIEPCPKSEKVMRVYTAQGHVHVHKMPHMEIKDGYLLIRPKEADENAWHAVYAPGVWTHCVWEDAK